MLEQSIRPTEQTLWPHQQAELEHTWDPARALFWEPRVGKTRPIVLQMRAVSLGSAPPSSIIYVNNSGLAAVGARDFRALITCPKNVANVWLTELATSWPEAFVLDCSDGPIVDRRALLKSPMHVPTADYAHPRVVVVNSESLHQLSLELMAFKPQFVVADESHQFKSAVARRTKALWRFSDAPFRRILTGTPDPQTYRDYYAQYKFLSPGLLAKNITEFDEQYVQKHAIFKKVTGYRNLPDLRAKLFSIASRLRVAECRGMPEVREAVRKVPLPHDARGKYDDLAHQLADSPVEIRRGVSHTLTRMLRLAQLTAGFEPDYVHDGGFDAVADVNRSAVRWVHEAKVHAVLGELSEILEADKKVVISFRFRAEGQKLLEAIDRTYGAQYDHGIALFDGSTTTSTRAATIEHFSRPNSSLKVLLVQEQIGSLGIDLSVADYLIFPTMGFDYATHFQMRQRIYKPQGKVCYIYIISPKTIDEFVLKTLRKKKSASAMMLDMAAFKRAAQGEE